MLIGLTTVLLGWSHYSLHFLKRGNRFSTVTTWVATVAVLGFWIYQWGIK